MTIKIKVTSKNQQHTLDDLNTLDAVINLGTHEDERAVLFKTTSLDGIKPNTNPKSNPKTSPNPNPNTNPNPKPTLILTLFSCFMLFSNTVL